VIYRKSLKIWIRQFPLVITLDVMKLLRTGETPQRITKMLDKHLEKHADRALFDLPQSIKSKENVQRSVEEMIGA